MDSNLAWSRVVPALLAAVLTGACGVDRRPVGSAPSDFATRVDLALPDPDLAEPVDLSPPPDLEPEPEPDLAMPGCSMVGTWDLGLDNALTLDAQGGFNFELGPFGKYRRAGNRLTVQDDFSPECAMVGTYTLQFNAQCSLVTVRVVQDPCVDRTMVFEMQDWVRR